uniref:Uncharacterized protein isoform X3 n=1 Tax=Nicotiana tabacum TaxID=4097 RepID=A0A1S3ZZ67_TOBAC|nr:PREDICTED: uncharacterized protein LOC107792071 isoform X3 [Nicotiana tabacum]XP_016469742.1 PREDICTED: uncharacterized protein LOC107792071 isoform X3 [Nicotiana tabacum]
MYPERRNKWPYAEHPNSDKNVRRHDIYGQISPDKKETMLLQRRTKELERQKWNSSIKSTVDPDERVMYQCHPMIRKDSALTITEASSADDEVGSKHDVNTSSSSLDKGKNVGHASSVFERGSTSRIYKGQHNVFPIATRKGYRTWTRRQKRNVIGRVVTCHPTEGERYYLRLLLMNVRGPKSYEDLRTVNEVRCSTFRESTEKRGLLYCNNSLIE